MSITFDEVFPILAQAVPGFEADEEDRREPTPYVFLSDMVKFVCQRVASGSSADASAFAALLEKLLLEGDGDVRDLVQDGLEGLLHWDTREAVAEYFGRKTLELWIQVCQCAGAEPRHQELASSAQSGFSQDFHNRRFDIALVKHA